MQTGPIIVGLDGHTHDEDALALAQVLASVTGRELVCAHVLPTVIGGRGMAQYESSLEREARSLLEMATAEAGVPTTTALLRGESAARSLSHIADERSASLLVLASTHRGPVGQLVPGSVASQLLTRAPCAIAVAPAGYARQERRALGQIGVAYDGMSESNLAGAEAVEFAARVGASIRLYHAFHEVPQGPAWDAFRANMHAFAQQVIDGGIDRLRARAPVTGRVLEGSAATAIAAAADDEGVGLLFAGSRGYGPLREALLGGVAGALLSTARCPLVILPRTAAEHAR